MSIKRLVSVLLVVGISVGATALNTTAQEPRPSALSQMSVFDAVQAKSIPTAIVESLGSFTADKPVALDSSIDPGEPLGDDTARLLHTDSERGIQVFAQPTTRGHVCRLVLLSDGSTARGCIDSFPEGSLVDYVAMKPGNWDDTAMTLTGLAADDVTKVEIILEDGSSSGATLGRNAWSWRADSPGALPSKIVATDSSGASHTLHPNLVAPDAS